MIKVRLREMMEEYSQKTGKKMTYSLLAERTGISKSTLETIGSRPGYNTTLSVIDSICSELECPLEELVVHVRCHQ